MNDFFPAAHPQRDRFFHGKVALTVLLSQCLLAAAHGQIIAWGENNAGQTSVPAGLTNVTAIAAGWDHSLALRSDRRVVSWGSQTTVPAGVSNVMAIAAGKSNSLA